MIWGAPVASPSPASQGRAGNRGKASRRSQSENRLGQRSMLTRRSLVERQTKLALADSQREAVRVALVSKVLVIIGRSGRRKDDSAQLHSQDPSREDHRNCALCAEWPCRENLSESTGLDTKTIYRRLEIDPRTGSIRRNDDAPLDCDLVVVDETSMVDLPLMRAILRALPEEAALCPGLRPRAAAIGRTEASTGVDHFLRRPLGGALHRDLPPRPRC